MGYFDIFKDKASQKTYKGVGKKAVSTQAKKRKQLREAAGGGGKAVPKPTKRSGKLKRRKKKIKGIFDRLKRGG